MPILLQLAQSYQNPESVNYKLAYLREQMEQQLLNLGDLAYEDQVQLAMLGETIIVGGYLRTELIAANSITADKINVASLSAISADLGSVTAGNISGVTITGATIRTSSSSNRVQLDGTDLKAYYNGIRRVQLDYDSLDFYNDLGQSAGGITAGWADYEVYTNQGAAEITVTDFRINTSEHGSITLYSQSNVTGKSAIMFIRTGGRTPNNANYNGEIKLQVWNGSDTQNPYVWLRDTQEIWINAPNGISFSGGNVGIGVYNPTSKLQVNGTFSASGTKSAIVETEHYGKRKLYAIEAPDVRFIDMIKTEKLNGEQWVELNPMFAETISDYEVFISGNAEVLDKQPDKFLVNGQGKALFLIYGLRKGYEGVYMEQVGGEEVEH